MAEARGNDAWLRGTNAHMYRLAARRVRLCPEYAPVNKAAIYAKWFKDMAKLAAKGAIRFFTFGAYPGA